MTLTAADAKQKPCPCLMTIHRLEADATILVAAVSDRRKQGKGDFQIAPAVWKLPLLAEGDSELAYAF
jgi:hypothetical protein